MGGASDSNLLPPGFHFFPSDEELVVHFLRRKASLQPCQPDIIPTVCMNHYDPWELNDKALEAGNQWYFFSHAKHCSVTPNGYWSSVCADETVSSGGCSVGLKKTLVFSTGEPSESNEGTETNWIMHEYHLLDGRKGISSSTSSSANSSSKKLHHHPNTERNTWVICRVFDSTRTGGSQASCNEEGMELSCLDEVFLSLDDYDEVSLSNN